MPFHIASVNIHAKFEHNYERNAACDWPRNHLREFDPWLQQIVN